MSHGMEQYAGKHCRDSEKGKIFNGMLLPSEQAHVNLSERADAEACAKFALA